MIRRSRRPRVRWDVAAAWCAVVLLGAGCGWLFLYGVLLEASIGH